MFECCLKVLPLMSKDSPDSRPSPHSPADKMAQPNSQLSASDFSANSVLQRYTATEERVPKERPYVIRAIRPEELHQAYEIRVKTNYIFSKSSIEAAWKISPEQFLVAVNEQGEVYGTVSMVEFSEGVVYLGSLAVKPEHRGKGISAELMDALFENAEGYNMYMRCALDMEPLYDNMQQFAIRSKVLLGRNEPKVVNGKDIMVNAPKGVSIVDYCDRMFVAVNRYDSEVLTVERSNVLKNTIAQVGAVTKVAVSITGGIVGFGVFVEMTDGSYSFNHLAADSRDIAKMLLKKCVDCCPNASIVGVMLVSPLFPNEESSFLAELGWEAKSKSVCRFSHYELKFDYSRLFSM